MKHLILLSVVWLTACGPVPESKSEEKPKEVQYIVPDQDGCIVDNKSNLVVEHKVGPIQNLVKDKDYNASNGTCTVKFDIEVNGETYHLEETEKGMENIESLCYYAKERARKNLLLDLGGTFKTQQTVACQKSDKS